MREETAFGVGLNHSLKFSATPPQYSSTVNTWPRAFLSILTGRSVRKSLRLEINPRESGFCEPPRRGAVVPSGKVTLAGGVSGSLHFGAMVLNDIFASRYRKMSLAVRFLRISNGCPAGQGGLTHCQIHCNIVMLPRGSWFPDQTLQARQPSNTDSKNCPGPALPIFRRASRFFRRAPTGKDSPHREAKRAYAQNR